MKIMLARLAGFVSLILLTACVTPEAYRYDNELILQPNTRQFASGEVSIDILEVRIARSCKIQPVPDHGIIGARLVHVGLDGVPALRLTLTGNYISDLEKLPYGLRGSLRSSVREWLLRSGAGACLSVKSDADDRHPTIELIARQIQAQRPMNADRAIQTWYGPGKTGDDQQSPYSRVVVLRPGMHVCAQDIVEPQRRTAVFFEPDSKRDAQGQGDQQSWRITEIDEALTANRVYSVGGTTCAWVTDSKGGVQFSPSIGVLDKPLSPRWGNTEGFKQVSSWDEIQTPAMPDGRYLFAIVHGSRLPDEAPLKPEDYAPDLGSFVVRIKLDEPVRLGSTKCFEDGQPTVMCRGVEALLFGTSNYIGARLCGSANAAAVACIAFGRRATFSAEFAITVNGARTMVPVGARLATVLAQVAPDFLGPDNGSVDDGAYQQIGPDLLRRDRSLAKIKLFRWFEGRRVRVRLAQDAARFPLQPGDMIQW